MTTLADSNVLMDLFLADPLWLGRSRSALEDALDRGVVGISPVTYAEVAPAFETRETLDSELAGIGILLFTMSRGVAFLAGRVFREYRRRGGPRESLLADFFIGAQAAVGRHALLTRDPRRYRSYFPTVEIIEP